MYNVFYLLGFKPTKIAKKSGVATGGPEDNIRAGVCGMGRTRVQRIFTAWVLGTTNFEQL